MKQVEFKMPLRMLAALCFLLLSASAIAQQIAVNGHADYRCHCTCSGNEQWRGN